MSDLKIISQGAEAVGLALRSLVLICVEGVPWKVQRQISDRKGAFRKAISSPWAW